MKSLITTCAVLLGVCAAASAHDSMDTMKFHSATAIMVAGTELPAGDNTIQVLSVSDGNVVLLVRSDSGPQAFVLTNRLSGAPQAGGEVHVTLQHRGNVNQLDQIWFPDHTGYQVVRPGVE
jgi:hypothetical protein